MQIAYLDCFSGISGDMLLGALIDAGLPQAELEAALAGLDLKGYRLEITSTTQSSLQATRVNVQTEENQPHRHLGDIADILTRSRLEPPVREKAMAVFQCLAEAEASVHGCRPDEVHFHEVGAVDAIVDIVGTISGFHLLGINRIACSPLPMPRGWTTCAHGELPIPAPAVCALLQGLPVCGDNAGHELVTPTGAALVRVLAEEFGSVPPMRLTRTGYGAGSLARPDGRPNLLRLLTGESFAAAEAQLVEVIETALDDWSPETWPHVAGKLLDNGALDVHLVPVHMKKGRPGFLLRIVCEPAHAEAAKIIVLSETTAIGLRSHVEQRRTMPRETVQVETRWGTVLAKRIILPNGPVITPEYEECRRMAAEHNLSLRQVYDEVRRCCRDNHTA